MMFGTVVHRGVQNWYGHDEDTNDFANTSLVDIVAKIWPEVLPPDIWKHTRRAIEAHIETAEVEQAIMLVRPELKSPRTTKDFLNSDASKKLVALVSELDAACSSCETMSWPSDENPLKAYMKSTAIAAMLQERWKDLPRPITVERPFVLEFDGFVVKGAMDQLRQDPDPETGEVIHDLRDIKTGRQPMTQMQALIQMFIYWEACLQNPELPTPDQVTFDLVRLGKLQTGMVDYERHRKIVLQIMKSVARRIMTADYEPRFGMWCKTCDYFGDCSEDIRLWDPETDGLTVVAA